MSMTNAEAQASGQTLPDQTGFTLIEVLIAVLVIAIGLLGLAGLQTVVIANGHISSMRSIASIHSENMAEMMRANLAGVNANDYANIAYGAIDPDAAPAQNCRDPADPCTANEQAQADAFHWIEAIARDLLLPAGGVLAPGAVVCNDRDSADADPCTNGSTHTITVSWQEKDSNSGAMVNRSFSTVFAA